MKSARIASGKIDRIVLTEDEFLEALEEVGLDFLVEVDLNIVPIVIVSNDNQTRRSPSHGRGISSFRLSSYGP